MTDSMSPEPRDGWPCDDHTAHGSHPAYSDPYDPASIYECPGVKAHPLNMIGRA